MLRLATVFVALVCGLALVAAHDGLAETGGAVLSVTPTVLQTSGDPVSISWSGVDHPGSQDIVAIYSPSSAYDDQYLGFFNCTSVETWHSGYGSIASMLVNMRQDYEYRLWSWDGSDFAVVASSGPISFKNYAEPLQPHLAKTGVGYDMSLMWVSAINATSAVSWGTSPGQYRASAGAAVWTYGASDMCTAPANDSRNPVNFIDPGYQYMAVMSGLSPGMTYYYSFGSESTGMSREFSFTVGPAVGDPIERIHLFGDLGVGLDFSISPIVQQLPSLLTTQWLAERPSSLVMLYGDISYARGHAFLWDWFFHQISNVTSDRPWMVAPGNHEIDWPGQPFNPPWSSYGTDSGGECGIPYDKRFTMPANGDGNYHYSFDHGNIHFTVFSTESDFLPSSDQWDWMDRDLAAVNRTLTPFVIVGGHRPIYSTKQGLYFKNSNMTAHIKDSIEPLLLKYNVSMYLAGHEHSYERTCPMANGACVAEGLGPVHAIIGMAGETFQTAFLNTDDGHYYQPAWTRFRAAEWGFTEIKTNATHLRFRFIGDYDDHIHDEAYVAAPGYERR